MALDAFDRTWNEDEPGEGRDGNIGWTSSLPDTIGYCVHAPSLDERRGNADGRGHNDPRAGLGVSHETV